jgi:hypothetical protein
MVSRKHPAWHALVTVLLLLPPAVMANEAEWFADPDHFDIDVRTDPPAAVGATIRVDGAGTFPVAWLTGHKVVPTDLSGFGGGPFATANPGWIAAAGYFLPGEDLRFRPLGALGFWDVAQRRWTDQVPNGEAIRIFPGIPPEVLAEILRTNDTARRFQWLAGFVFTTAGVTGPPEGVGMLAIAGGSGAFHSHFDFCLQGAAGFCPPAPGTTVARGAYRIELQLFSTATANGRLKYAPSPPIYVVLAYGLSTAELGEAVDALTDVPAGEDDTGSDFPGAGVLIIAGGPRP